MIRMITSNWNAKSFDPISNSRFEFQVWWPEIFFILTLGSFDSLSSDSKIYLNLRNKIFETHFDQYIRNKSTMVRKFLILTLGSFDWFSSDLKIYLNLQNKIFWTHLSLLVIDRVG